MRLFSLCVGKRLAELQVRLSPKAGSSPRASGENCLTEHNGHASPGRRNPAKPKAWRKPAANLRFVHGEAHPVPRIHRLFGGSSCLADSLFHPNSISLPVCALRVFAVRASGWAGIVPTCQPACSKQENHMCCRMSDCSRFALPRSGFPQKNGIQESSTGFHRLQQPKGHLLSQRLHNTSARPKTSIKT